MSNSLKTSVVQIGIDGVPIKTWAGAIDVERKLGIKRGNIIYCCKNRPRFKTAGGFRWEYADMLAAQVVGM